MRGMRLLQRQIPLRASHTSQRVGAVTSNTARFGTRPILDPGILGLISTAKVGPADEQVGLLLENVPLQIHDLI